MLMHILLGDIGTVLCGFWKLYGVPAEHDGVVRSYTQLLSTPFFILQLKSAVNSACTP